MAKQSLQFPMDKLVPSGGEIYCHIFENDSTGIARNLFWSINVNFKPIKHGGEQFTCSMTCEWIRWPVRDWRDLDGRLLDVEYGTDGIESSFYMTEHDTATQTKLALRREQGNIFLVKVDMLVDFTGYFGDDANPAMPVHAEVKIPFIGLIVVPGNLYPKPSTVSEVRTIASEFVDLAAFQSPKRRKDDDFIFRPKAS